MSSDKLDYNGLDTLSTVIKNFVIKKLGIEIADVKQYNKEYTDDKIEYVINISSPIGTIQAYAGNSLPDGWLLCDGSAVSRTTYSNLFSVINTVYGSGNGSTTFNLPNLINKFIQGNNTVGTVKNAGLPNITGTQFLGWQDTSAGTLIFASSSGTGAFTGPTYKAITNQKYLGPSANNAASSHRNVLNFNASKSSSIYGASTTVQPPALTMIYIIKY